AISARRRAAATCVANVAGGRLPGFDLLESLVRLLGGIDVEHLRPRQVEQSVWHRVAPFACNEKRNRVAGQCRTRRQYRAGLLRAGDARLSAMDRAASRVLGDVHDDGVRSDDWNIARGNNIAEPRYAVERAAERRDHHGDLEAGDARPSGTELVTLSSAESPKPGEWTLLPIAGSMARAGAKTDTEGR